jgi:hypothetical protein
MSGTLLDLGSQPLVNNLCNSANEALEAERFPLRAVYEDDLTIHLDTEVPPEKLYAHYLYRSGVNRPYIEHCKELYKSLSHLNMGTVIDVGGNDGTLLNAFRETSKEIDFWSGIKPKQFINVDISQNLKEINEEAGNTYMCAVNSTTPWTYQRQILLSPLMSFNIPKTFMRFCVALLSVSMACGCWSFLIL